MSADPEFPDEMALGVARDLLRTKVDEGHDCPLCRQHVKVYKRKLPIATVRVMIALHNHIHGREFGANEFVFLPPILDTMTGTPAQGGYGTLGHFWGLLQQQDGHRDDGSSRVGWWRLTTTGTAFVRGIHRVPKYAKIYNGRCLGTTGDLIDVKQALGNRFSYEELMRGV